MNPRGLQLRVQHQDEKTFIDFEADESWQGFGGVVHGGLVATVLDEVMAWELYGHDDFAVTGKLEVRYHRPVPIHRLLRATAELVEDRGHAKKLRAIITDEQGTVYARAESLFLKVPRALEDELRRQFPDDGSAPEEMDAAAGSTTGG
ncbi:MAG: PaaI family thioesterase [Chloroflexi bacterium]|nr:PaaI family thioesterase [Chloroflexota bacterium]